MSQARENFEEQPPIRPPVSRLGAALVALGLAGAYVASRGLLYWLMPAATDRAWCFRDTVTDAPRAFFLFCAWRYGRRLWRPRQLGLHRQKLRECAVLGALLCSPLAARPFFFTIGQHTPGWLPALIVSALLAALLEEVLLRSVLLRALFDQFGARTALWGSTLAFLCFHMPTQPWWTWPDLFAFGFCLGLQRLKGASLWGICAIHAAFNVLSVVLPPSGEYPPLWYISVFLVHAYLAAMYAAAYRVRILVSDTFW